MLRLAEYFFFLSNSKNTKTTYENIRRITTGQGDDHKIGFLLDYAYFRDNYKMIVIDVSKQKVLDVDLQI